jgi:tetratricopeptide (TPR) repeat protein
LERNLHLLELDNIDKPDDSFTLFNLGWTLLDLGRLQESLGHLQRSLEVAVSDASIVRKLYQLIAVVHRQLGQKEAAQEMCRTGLERFADDTELLMEEATLLLEAKDFAKAEINLLQLVENKPGRYFGSADDGVRGFRTRHMLAGQYLERHRRSEAEVQWRMANEDRPKFLPAWLALGELYLKQDRWKALDQLTAGLERETGAILEAVILRARGHFARNEFRKAASALDDVLPRYPDAVGPRMLLSHVLLKEGRDWHGAERALRDVLRVEPESAEAKGNLELLLRRQLHV